MQEITLIRVTTYQTKMYNFDKKYNPFDKNQDIHNEHILFVKIKVDMNNSSIYFPHEQLKVIF